MANSPTKPREDSTDSGSSAIARRDGDGPLATERGNTQIADVVVSKVAGIAAREIRGVHDLGGATTRALGAVTSRLPVGDERARGVTVEVGEREAAVDLVVRVEYGESIPKVAEAVRENVLRRVEGITGLSVTEVNIDVTDLFFPGDDEPEESRVQ